MSNEFTPDRFDEPGKRAMKHGIHRAPRRGIARMSLWAWAGIVTFTLSAIGVGTIISIDQNLFQGVGEIFPDFQVTASPSVDPAMPVTVLNSTGSAAYTDILSELLENEGFTVDGATEASKSVSETIVYYSDEDAQAAALAVVQTLGVGRIDYSDAYDYLGSKITAVVGSDFK